MNGFDIYVRMNLTRHKLQKPFISCFQTSLSKFWDPLNGFDVIKFDDWLKVPKGTSTHDFVLTNYGQSGVDIIMALIKA